jgi:hypothetical protein
VGKAKIDFDTVVVRGYAIGQTVGPILCSAVNCGSAAGPWVITYELQGLPGMGGGGVIELTFPKEPAPHDETEIVTTVGTDKGEYKAVGLPGGVKFGGPASATLQAASATQCPTHESAGVYVIPTSRTASISFQPIWRID